MSSVYVPIYVPYFACTSTESLYDATPAAQTDSENTTMDTGEYIPKVCGRADNLQPADGVDEDSNGHVDTNLGAEAIATTSEHDGCESDVDCASEPSSNPFTNLPPEALTAFHRALSQLTGIRRDVAINRLKQVSAAASEDLAILAAGVSENDFLEYVKLLSQLLDKEWALPANEHAGSTTTLPATAQQNAEQRNVGSKPSRAASCNVKVVHAGGKTRSSRSKSHRPHRNTSLRPVRSGNQKSRKRQ